MPKGLFQTAEERMKVEGYSRRTIRAYLRELRKFVEYIRPRPEHKLPRILSRDEILQIVRTIQNPHRLMVELLYAAGLRVSEVVNFTSKT